MKVLVINGNPKRDGFIGGSLDIIANRLQARGAEVDRLNLADARIEDCRGCFACLRTGACPVDDDMAGIIRRMAEADGYVVGSPVRNGLVTACYKRFYERITYLLGFTLAIEDKHTLAVSSVGFAGGKAVNRKLLGLQDVFRTRLSDYLFFKIGIPSRFGPEDVRESLEQAADRLMHDIETNARKGIIAHIAAAVDRIVIRRCVFAKDPAAFAHVIQRWKEKRYM
ncbi:MAG: flavodoxin family protein [Planctomycetota bacterium]